MDVERDYKAKGTVSKRVTFPLLFWEEFEADCRENFNDTYFLKIKHDHEFRKSFQTVAALLMQDILDLKEEVAELKNKLSESPKTQEVKKTFGGQ